MSAAVSYAAPKGPKRGRSSSGDDSEDSHESLKLPPASTDGRGRVESSDLDSEVSFSADSDYSEEIRPMSETLKKNAHASTDGRGRVESSDLSSEASFSSDSDYSEEIRPMRKTLKKKAHASTVKNKPVQRAESKRQAPSAHPANLTTLLDAGGQQRHMYKALLSHKEDFKDNLFKIICFMLLKSPTEQLWGKVYEVLQQIETLLVIDDYNMIRQVSQYTQTGMPDASLLPQITTKQIVQLCADYYKFDENCSLLIIVLKLYEFRHDPNQTLKDFLNNVSPNIYEKIKKQICTWFFRGGPKRPKQPRPLCIPNVFKIENIIQYIQNFDKPDYKKVCEKLIDEFQILSDDGLEQKEKVLFAATCFLCKLDNKKDEMRVLFNNKQIYKNILQTTMPMNHLKFIAGTILYYSPGWITDEARWDFMYFLLDLLLLFGGKMHNMKSQGFVFEYDFIEKLIFESLFEKLVDEIHSRRCTQEDLTHIIKYMFFVKQDILTTTILINTIEKIYRGDGNSFLFDAMPYYRDINDIVNSTNEESCTEPYFKDELGVTLPPPSQPQGLVLPKDFGTSLFAGEPIGNPSLDDPGLLVLAQSLLGDPFANYPDLDSPTDLGARFSRLRI